MVKHTIKYPQRTSRKTTELLPAIMGSVVWTNLSFLHEVLGFAAEHTPAFLQLSDLWWYY